MADREAHRMEALETLEARHAALEAELADQRRELEQTEELLDEERQRRSLPVIARLRVASPCRTDWSKMDGDDRVRHCGECKQHVYNLSAMTLAEAAALTLAEAAALIAAVEQRPCVRYFERPDGTILFSDCAVVRSRRRRSRVLAAAAVVAIGAGMAQLANGPRAEQSDDLADFQATVGALDLPISELRDEDLAGLSPEDARAYAVEAAQQVLRDGDPLRVPPELD